jgi:hypothetical protein
MAAEGTSMPLGKTAFRRAVFLLSFTGLMASNAQAQLFSLTGRTYGSSSSTQSNIDTIFNLLEDTVNALLPNADITSYLKTAANASIMAGSGVTLDPFTDFKLIYMHAGAGLGYDLGGANYSDFFEGRAKLNQLKGAGVNAGVVLGINPGFVFKSLDRWKLYVNWFDLNATGTYFDAILKSYSFKVRYDLIQPKGKGRLRWAGISLISGFDSFRNRLVFRKSVSESVSYQFSQLSGNPNIEASVDGNLELGADVKLTNIPVDLATGYWMGPLGFVVGVGYDHSSGTAKAVSSISSPVTISNKDNPNDTSFAGVTATPTLTLGQDSSPTANNYRYYLGVQVNGPKFGWGAQYTRSFVSTVEAFAVNVHLFL